MSFSQRMILSMLAVLLLFALINGLLVYSMIKRSDVESIAEFNEMLQKEEEETIDSWLDIAHSVIYPYVILSRKHADSSDIYKGMVLEFLKGIRWDNRKKHDGFYFVFNSKTGKAVLFMDSLGNIMPQSENVLEITDVDGKKFVKEILEKSFTGDASAVTFKYLKSCLSCPATERLSKGIYISDWNWIVAAGNYSDKLYETSKFFTNKFNDNRTNLVGNLFGIMLVSFLIGLFLIFKQMNSFVVPLRNLSSYIHSLAIEGIRFENVNINVNSQEELKNLANDLNSVVHNVGSLIENVRVSADSVSDLSGTCTDMLDIVDYDAKLVGQRTVEMTAYSENVIDNVNGMAVGIEEIYINLDGLKKLTSHIAENTTDIKSSVSQMSEAMKELNEKSFFMRNSVISVTQAVNDIGLVSTEELSKIDSIRTFATSLSEELEGMAAQIGEFRKCVTQSVNSIGNANGSPGAANTIKNMCDIADDLYGRMASVQTQVSNLQQNHIAPFAQAIEERKNLSKEISTDTTDLNSLIDGVVNRIAEINSSSQYINSSVKYMSSDINDAYRNLEDIVNATDGMNDHAKQAMGRMDEFASKLKKVEEAHYAIEHTLIDVKNSMKSLNDLSASLRKVVNDLVRLDKTQQIEV